MACDAPITIKYKEPIPDGKGGFIWTFPADCGKCLKCLLKRKAQWSFRLVEQKRVSFSSYFVTLTYNDKYLPMGDGVSSINKNDHKEFIKKLKEYEKPKNLALRPYISKEELERSKIGIKDRGKLAYYGVSEYGDQFGRSHWHYILFNVRDINNIDRAWFTTVRNDQTGEYEPGEQKGNIKIDECNINTIDYVLKYMVKDHSKQDYEGRAKEVSFMSKGIGITYVDQEFIDYINREDANQVMNQRGSILPLPRYYRKKFVKEENMQKKNLYIAEQVEKKAAEELQKYGDRYDTMVKLSKDRRMYLMKMRNKRNVE